MREPYIKLGYYNKDLDIFEVKYEVDVIYTIEGTITDKLLAFIKENDLTVKYSAGSAETTDNEDFEMYMSNCYATYYNYDELVALLKE